MIALLTNIAPIALGFIGKLFALKSQAASENQKLMMQQFAVRDKSINDARSAADKESPMAALNRRVIIFVILSLIIFTQVAPVFFNVPTVVPTVIEGASILGFELTPDTIEYVTVQAGAVLKFDEVFAWATMIIEFYFGAQLAKGK
jgi:hypothetical protein